MTFNVKAILFNVKTNESKEVTFRGMETVEELLDTSSISQISIDKYHKIYFNSSESVISNGITGWVTIDKEYDSNLGWVDTVQKEFIAGENIVLLLCDDSQPIDMTEKAKEFIISHLKI